MEDIKITDALLQALTVPKKYQWLRLELPPSWMWLAAILTTFVVKLNLGASVLGALSSTFVIGVWVFGLTLLLWFSINFIYSVLLGFYVVNINKRMGLPTPSREMINHSIQLVDLLYCGDSEKDLSERFSPLYEYFSALKDSEKVLFFALLYPFILDTKNPHPFVKYLIDRGYLFNYFT